MQYNNQQASMQHQSLHPQQSIPQQPSPSQMQLQRPSQQQSAQQIQSEHQQLQPKQLQPQPLRQPQAPQAPVQTQTIQQTQTLQPQPTSTQPLSTHSPQTGGLQVPSVSQGIVNTRLNTTGDPISSNAQHSPTTRPAVPQPPSVPTAQLPQQPVPANQWNTATLCKYGQETVQDIVSKVQDMFQILKNLQPPSGIPSGTNMSNEKRAKIQEQLRNIRMLFKKLRIIYEKCNDSSQLQGMEYMHIESLIPLKEEWDMKSEERKTSELYRTVLDESKELMNQVQMKNAQLKEIIDNLRRIIWEVNTMLAMRKS